MGKFWRRVQFISDLDFICRCLHKCFSVHLSTVDVFLVLFTALSSTWIMFITYHVAPARGSARLSTLFIETWNEPSNFDMFTFFQQYGNKVGDGQFRGKAIPTYVYPDCLKAAIREILNWAVRDYPNPETSAVRILFFRIVQPPDTISPKRRL